jgi:hypothetical protein
MSKKRTPGRMAKKPRKALAILNGRTADYNRISDKKGFKEPGSCKMK